MQKNLTLEPSSGEEIKPIYSPSSTNLRIKVTHIKNRWHTRLFVDDKIVDEMACEFRQDIGYICRTMMRWLDKCGGSTVWTSSARKRHSSDDAPSGKIWYFGELKHEPQKSPS